MPSVSEEACWLELPASALVPPEPEVPPELEAQPAKGSPARARARAPTTRARWAGSWFAEAADVRDRRDMGAP